jgi:hypothetical protein
MTLRRVSALVTALALGACTGAKKTEQAQSAMPSAPAGPVRIIAADYSFSNVPDTLAPGWHNILLVNQGKRPHMAAIARLDSGKTVADLEAGAAHGMMLPPWMTEVGGVNAIFPGDSAMAAVDLPAGNYVIGCFINDSTGKPHLLDGMIAAFTVAEGGVAAMAEPITDDTVHLTSYTITFTTPPTSGMHLYRVEDVDTAAVDHDFFLVRIQDGKTQQDVLAWLGQIMSGTVAPTSPPPFTIVGGTTGMRPGLHADVHLELTPGKYLALCAMPDAKDGKPHFVHGMMATFEVKE